MCTGSCDGGEVPPEVYHPGEDTTHEAGVAVSGANMYDGLPADFFLLVIEGKCYNCGPAECRER